MRAAQEKKSVRVNILLTESQERKLDQVARDRGISKAAYVRHALEQAFERDQRQAIQKAVRELAPLYLADPELTAFTELDGEDFR